MASVGLIDQGWLDGASNYVIWKPRISCLLNEHDFKTYVDSVVVVPANANPLKKYKKEMVRAKRFILDGVRDHVVSHIAGKHTTRQMWEALAMLNDLLSSGRCILRTS